MESASDSARWSRVDQTKSLDDVDDRYDGAENSLLKPLDFIHSEEFNSRQFLASDSGRSAGDGDEWCARDKLVAITRWASLGLLLFSPQPTALCPLWSRLVRDSPFYFAISAQLLVGLGLLSTHNQKIVTITRIAFMPHFPTHPRWRSEMCTHKHNNVARPFSMPKHILRSNFGFFLSSSGAEILFYEVLR